ncbi:peptidase inhibitor family I36 protein [Nonomuraea longicatena]|uniref:Peptidase inhibitor family I36 n=1 Tax=Nonomuraea longicatena TaxID=83682 RepID=A0ABP4AEJ0_9ACTN
MTGTILGIGITAIISFLVGMCGNWIPRPNWATPGRVLSIAIAFTVLGGATGWLIENNAAEEATPAAAVPSPSGSPSASRPTCTSGSICLWPERGFTGDAWVWSPGISQEGTIPKHLRDHVGSFDSQTTGCFVDTESQATRPVSLGDWSERYLDTERFGRVMDSIRIRC